MTDNRNTVVCFTGHRYYTPTPGNGERLAAALDAALAGGYRVFISGMAPGFDLAAAEAVVRLRDGGCGDGGASGAGRGDGGGESLRSAKFSDMRLVAAIPFARQAAKYSADDRARYEALLEAADEVAVLSERYFYGCYYRRDDWMVDRSARIICWYDGSSDSRGAARSGSGTRYTVRRALESALEIVNLFRDPDTLF